MMKRLLIVGASILQLPAIQRAKELGYQVAVADYNPQAVGIAYADRYYNVSTIDEKGVCAAAEDFGADGIMTLATDMPMRSVAYTCEKLGFSGISYDTAVKATDKGEMIKAFARHGVAHPFFYILDRDAEMDALPSELIYPVICKPTDNAGSQGVVLIKNETELRDALHYSREHGRSGNVIIEEYMQGPEVSVETLSVNGECHVIQITDKLTTGAPGFVEMGHSQPSALSEDTLDKIRAAAIAANKAVGIENGPSHTEIIVTRDGPKIVELGARLGGDCITTHLVPLSTGVDMVECCIRIALGETPDVTRKFERGSAIRYFKQHSGVVKEIPGIADAEKIDGVRQISVVHGVSETVTDITSSGARMGFVIAQAATAPEAVEVCEEALRKIKVTIENV